MTKPVENSFLSSGEPEPASLLRPHGQSPYLLTCDHASNRIPKALGDMGLSEKQLARHIAWDIGALAVSEMISEALDATLVYQNYSRLVIDCNRNLQVPDSIPEVSERTVVPANVNLSDAEKQRRTDIIHTPYHHCISQQFEQRAAAQKPTIFIAMHSYTPVFMGTERPWQMSLMYHLDRRFAGLLLDTIHEQDPDILVGDNEPYFVSDKSDYGIPIHGEQRGVPHVLIELRQDLIAYETGQREWAARCIRWLQACWGKMDELK